MKSKTQIVEFIGGHCLLSDPEAPGYYHQLEFTPRAAVEEVQCCIIDGTPVKSVATGGGARLNFSLDRAKCRELASILSMIADSLYA